MEMYSSVRSPYFLMQPNTLGVIMIVEILNEHQMYVGENYYWPFVLTTDTSYLEET